ncbi:MAG: hypothetical protein JO209_07110 [Acidisphaera sp.]|nr:hypothetical protein [Acidisphaera sp.]
MPVRSHNEFLADFKTHLHIFVDELDAAYAEYREKTRELAPKLESRTKAGIIRDLAARRMREVCEKTKGAQFIRRGNLGVVGWVNNWILRPKKLADGFKVAVSPTSASRAYNRNEVPASLSGALLSEPPATCLYLGWIIPENAPERIAKYVVCNNQFGEIAWVHPLDEDSPPPAQRLPIERPPQPGDDTRRVRVRVGAGRKANG